MVARAKEFGEIIGELDPVRAKARDERLRAELRAGTAETIRQKYIPNLESGFIASGAPLAGSLFVQPYIRRADGSAVRLDDLMRLGFAIVAGSAEPLRGLSAEARRMWQAIGGEQIVIGVTVDSDREDVSHLVETDSLFQDLLCTNNLSAVIVRPDRYIFGGAKDAADLDNLIGELCSGLSLSASRLHPGCSS